MSKALTSRQQHLRRKRRVRAKISGTASRPRLCVFRGLSNMYAQIVDDTAGKTLASVHSKSIDKSAAEKDGKSGKIAVAYEIGVQIANKAKEAGIITVVFDRSGYAFQGRVQAVADGARSAGLQF